MEMEDQRLCIGEFCEDDWLKLLLALDLLQNGMVTAEEVKVHAGPTDHIGEQTAFALNKIFEKSQHCHLNRRVKLFRFGRDHLLI